MARYPSGKGEVCKTFMRRFDSDPRLQPSIIFFSETDPTILRQTGMRTRFGASFLFAALLTGAALAAAQESVTTAQVVAHWREAVHAKDANKPAALLVVTE